MRLLLSAVGAAMILAMLSATPASADPVSAAMERDLGLSSSQVQTLWADEARARTVADTLSPSFSRSAMWFADGALHVSVTDSAQAAHVRTAGGIPHLVTRGSAVLEKIAQSVRPAPGIATWGVDAAGDAVVVTLTAGVAQKVRDDLRALSPAIRLVEPVAAPHLDHGDLVGGEYWKPGSEGSCSIGFSATGSGGTRHFLTAGHCTNDANQPAYGSDGHRLGTSNPGGDRSVNAREGDFGLVNVTEDGWNLTARVSGHGEGDYTVTGSAEPTVGMSVCHSGGNTKLRCGKVTQVNQTIDYGTVIIEGLFVTDACSGAGDSGGSYVTGPKNDAKAIGLHSGGGNGCGQTGPTTIGQPVNEALAKWGMTLYLGTPQPGTPTVTNPGNQTTPVNTAVTLSNTAGGGTAPYTWTASGLPVGLSLNADSGTISGTPTVEGASSVTLTATDTAGKSGSATFTWTVAGSGGGSPVVRDPGYQNAYIGRPYTLQMTATGGATPYSWTATGLPTGLSINSSTGQVSGTATRWGLYTSTVTVRDAAGKTASVRVGWSVWS